MRAALSIFAAAAVLAAASLSLRTIDAHGTVDQMVDGDPFCNPFNFKAYVEQSGGQRQTFTPSQDGLSGVDVCVSGVDTVNVAIRDSSDEVIGGASAPVTWGVGGDWFTHVNFVLPYDIPVGESLTIEVISATPLRWYGNAPGDVYVYEGGSSNAVGTVDDFAFRSYYAPLPPPPPTATPTNTVPPTPTRTRTPTLTPEPSSTSLPTSTSTPEPPPGVATATAPPDDPAAPPTSPATGPTSSTQPTSTRVSGVLGAQQFTGRVYLPDVGEGLPRRRRSDEAVILLLALGIASFALGAMANAHSRTRTNRK
ncbi:MAG TPA: hypothetical protein VIH21_08680 [Dehalococcoidia bacterium]